MPEIRKRTTRPVSRKRDRARAAEEETEEEETEDVDTTKRAPRKSTSKVKAASRRTPDPVDEDEEEEEEEEEEEPEEEEEEEPEEEEEEEDEEEEDEPPRKAKVKKKTAATKKKSGLPLGVKTGWAGSESVEKQGKGVDRLTLSNEPVLIKALQPAPFASYRQHWFSSGPGEPDLPYTCGGDDCPGCAMGDNAGMCNLFNVLVLSGDGEPSVKQMQLAVKANRAFKEAATSSTGKINIQNGFWAIKRSGKNQQSQTNFTPVKERDLEEDWGEIFENFDIEDLPEIIDEAKTHLYDTTAIPGFNKKKMLELTRYLTEED